MVQKQVCYDSWHAHQPLRHARLELSEHNTQQCTNVCATVINEGHEEGDKFWGMYTLNIVSEAVTIYGQNCVVLNVTTSTQLFMRPNKMFNAIKLKACTRGVKG
jgi:hypothetical protein